MMAQKKSSCYINTKFLLKLKIGALLLIMYLENTEIKGLMPPELVI
jgi:hypothetical protein